MRHGLIFGAGLVAGGLLAAGLLVFALRAGIVEVQHCDADDVDVSQCIIAGGR